jgi:redox-sensing transcriptional repressor
MKKKIPNPTLKRLPVYYNIFCSADDEGRKTISSAEIADFIGVDHTQVRKDMAAIEFAGKPKVGFDVASFISYFNKIMKLRRKKKAVIVGAGNLGIAIARYDGFKKYGLEVCGVFDSDPYKIGLKVKTKEISSISALPEFIKTAGVQVAILTVPAPFAQEVVDTLIESGIKSIWNFAPVSLKVSDDVILWNQDLAASFLTLSIMMAK